MIRKTLLTFLLLFAAHALAVRFLEPLPDGAQNQWQANVIKAQRFIHEKTGTDRDNIIVGSSLSCRLDMRRFPPGYYNLSFAGLGIFDGLNILSRTGADAKNVFIEMNVVIRPEDARFSDDLFSPVSYSLQRSVPSLRQDRQPVTLLSAFIKKAISAGNASSGEKAPPEARPDNLEQVLHLQKESYSRPPERPVLKARLEALQRSVAALEQRGVNVAFYEAPVHPELCSSPLAEAIREGFREYFPPTRFRYIPMPDCSLYRTTDGLHLTERDAFVYSGYLRDEADKLAASASPVRPAEFRRKMPAKWF
jgi:hypothetical protein